MTGNFPLKKRDFHNHHFDSTVWDDFQFRDDDIVIGTYAKSGTTWVQQIVSQLIFSGEEGLDVAAMSPWIDLRVPPKEEKIAAVEAQKHRPISEDPSSSRCSCLFSTRQISLHRSGRP